MNLYNRLRLAMRRGWDRMDATLLDSRRIAIKGGQDGTSTYQVWEYMIEVPGPGGGAPVRLTFKEQSHRVRGAPASGDVVPVIVNAKRTKAMFDLGDERIDNEGWVDEQVRRREQRDEQRFAARRAGLEPPPGTEPD